MIKVYQMISNPYEISNPFVHALMDGINELQKKITWGWGYEKFWMNVILDYDVILVHWPEALLFWDSHKGHTVDEFRDRINLLKSCGKKIVSVVHNLEPHDRNNDTKRKCYEIVYSSADVLFHMGEYSKCVMEKIYKQAKHIYIAPHFTYDQIYSNRYTKKQACEKLGFNFKNKYVLVFGAFRSKEERKIVAELAHDLKKVNQNITVLAPSFTFSPKSKTGLYLRARFKRFWLKTFKNIVCKVNRSDKVSETELPYYYAVADVCFIHRRKILNSGNIPLAFLMGKVVIGPNVGNVGELLKKTNNPVFNVNNRKNICDSVVDGLKLGNEGKGQWNYDYAMNHFSTEIFCRRFYEVLSSIVN